MLRVVRLHSRAFAAALAAIVLVIAGVLFLWLHESAGPLTVADLDSTAVVPASHPAVIVIPVNAPASDSVVIDSITVQNAGGVIPAPEVTGIYADPDTSCKGI